MCRGRTFLLVAIVLIMVLVANADLALTVNGLDTSMPIEVSSDDDIVIAVVGQTDEQGKSYSVTCEMGGKLEPLPESNTLVEKPKEGDYLFTFEDEELGLAIVNLTVGDLLDYQLILFKIPDANTVIFGIDSDVMEALEEEARQQNAAQENIDSVSQEIGIDGGSSPPMMMGAGWPEDPIWFDNPAECPDLDNDDFVNFVDFAIFAGNWLKTGDKLPGDFDENGTVDTNDLGHLCEYWLTPVDCPDCEFPVYYIF